LWLGEDLKEQVDRRKDETGVPTSIFVRRLIEAALNSEQQPKQKPRRRAAG
jgi:hypothetical protein